MMKDIMPVNNWDTRRVDWPDNPRRVATVLATIAGLVQILTVTRVYVKEGRLLLPTDTAMFEHAGWYWTHGGMPYVDFWLVKPPLGVETTAGLAVVSGGNLFVLHALSVFVTSLSLIGTVILIGLVTFRITDHGPASITAGVFFLAYTGTHYFAAYGFRPKYFTVFFGLLALYLRQTERPLLSGSAAAASAGYWQFGSIFVVVTLLYRVTRRDVSRVLAGVIIVTILTVLPIVLLGGMMPMIAEVIVANALTPDNVSLLSVLKRIGKGLLILGYATVPFVLGILGITYALIDAVEAIRAVALGTVLAGIQILFLDFDSGRDLFVLLAFSAVGIGLLVQSVSGRRRQAVFVLVSVSIMVSVVALGGFGIIFDDITTMRSDDEPRALMTNAALDFASKMEMGTTTGGVSNERQYTLSTATGDIMFSSLREKMNYVFWNEVKPLNCNFREHPKNIVEALNRLDPWISDETMAACSELSGAS